jgi:pantothenate kinase type III
MKLTFNEKGSKQYEAQDEQIDSVFESVKADIMAICDKYKDNNKDLIVAVCTIGIMSDNAKQTLLNQYGTDRIIEALEAKECFEGITVEGE